MNADNKKVSLWYLIKTFLKIGSISFGGFMALVSVVQKQVVEKDKAIKNEDVLDGISLATILPGPVSVNVVTYIGYKLRGIKGAIVSLLSIVLPSFILIVGLSYFYFKYGNIPLVDKIFAGIYPTIIAIILTVAINIGKKSIKDYKQVIICILSILALFFLSGYETTLIIIILSGFAGYFIYKKEINNKLKDEGFIKNHFSSKEIVKLFVTIAILIAVFVFFVLASQFQFAGKYKLISIFSTFGKMGITLLGGGYVFIPMIHDVIVLKLGWLTNKEFADGIAMGQITPGPIMISSTFIGYKVMHFWGAVAATIGMFCMPGMLMIICSKYYLIINKSEVIKVSLKGIRAAVLGMILAAIFVLSKSVEINLFSIVVFIIVFLLNYFKNIDTVILVIFSAFAGYLFA